MDLEYLIFIIGYDYAEKLEEMDLACDEAYVLAKNIAIKYKKHALKNDIEEYYDTFINYTESISFDDVWHDLNKQKN